MGKEKYIRYLEELGFKKATKDEIEEYVPDDFEYIYDASWYIYDGDLEIENLEMDNLPLLITGDLKMPSGAICTVDYNGLVVLGKTNVKWLSINGNTYLKDVTFSLALLTSGNGAPRVVEKAKGPFLYHCSDSAGFNDVSEVEFYINREDLNTIKNFCQIVKNPEKYTECIADWQLTEEQFESNDENMKTEYYSYERYLVEEVGINDDEIERAIIDGTFELKKTTNLLKNEEISSVWSNDNFANEHVHDWLFCLEASNDTLEILQPLNRILNIYKQLESESSSTPLVISLRMYNYLKNPIISEALASAEVIAASVTGDLSIIPSAAKNWLNKKQCIQKISHLYILQYLKVCHL